MECVYTKSILDSAIPTASLIPECNIATHNIKFDYVSLVASNPTTKIISEIGYTKLNKNIVIPASGGGAGALRSASNLVVNAAVTISPEPGN